MSGRVGKGGRVEITVGSCYCTGKFRASRKSLINLGFMNCDFT